jgi:membrane protease YdiL (CAAX protease family)
VAVVDAKKLEWSALISLTAYNYSSFLGGPLFEEPGWRGFALSRLQACFHPIIASVILGVLWATWHLPFFFFYPGWATMPVGAFYLLLVGLSLHMTFAANLGRFSVAPPIVIHVVHNSTGDYFRGLFAHSGPGDGGFINDAFRKIPLIARVVGNISLSFPTLIVIGVWIGALMLLVFSKGNLAFGTTKTPNQAPSS